jgi:hypothetical protein
LDRSLAEAIIKMDKPSSLRGINVPLLIQKENERMKSRLNAKALFIQMMAK